MLMEASARNFKSLDAWYLDMVPLEVLFLHIFTIWNGIASSSDRKTFMEIGSIAVY